MKSNAIERNVIRWQTAARGFSIFVLALLSCFFSGTLRAQDRQIKVNYYVANDVELETADTEATGGAFKIVFAANEGNDLECRRRGCRAPGLGWGL